MAKVICDIDGTLSDYSHRAHLIIGPDKHYEEFQSLSHLDPPIDQIITLLYALDIDGHDIRLWTGRHERYRKTTEEWLEKHLVPCHDLSMRPNGDNQSDFNLKEKWLDELGEQPLFAIDDRKSVVDMFRRRGIICLQPCEGRY